MPTKAALEIENRELREALRRLLPEARNDRYMTQTAAVDRAEALLSRATETDKE